MKNIIKNKKGLTLIEVLVYLVVFSLSVTTIVSFLLMISTVNSKNSIILDVESDAQFVFNFLERKIKNSNKIISPGMGMESAELVLDYEPGELRVFIDGGIMFVEELGVGIFQLTKSNLIIKNTRFILSGSDSKSIKISFELSQRTGESEEFKYEKKYYNTFSKY